MLCNIFLPRIALIKILKLSLAEMTKNIVKKFLFGAAGIILLFAAACNITSTLKVSPGSTFLVAQESPAPPNLLLNLYVNGTNFIPNIPYTGYSGYSSVAPGPYFFQLYYADSNFFLLNTDVTLQSGYNYSFFSFDSINTIQSVLVQDNLTIPTGDSAKIRFMQFSPIGTGDSIPDSTVQFAIHDSTAILLSGNRSFNDVSYNPALDNFMSIPAGPHTFQVALDSALTNIIYTSQDTLLAGKIYTLVLTGLTSEAGTIAQLHTYLVKHN